MSMHYVMEILPSLFQGAGMTLKLFFWTLLGSLPLGILVSLGLTSKFRPLQWLLELYVWLMRGTPLLLQLILFFMACQLLGLFFSVMMPRCLHLFSTMVPILPKSFGAAFSQLIKANMRQRGFCA